MTVIERNDNDREPIPDTVQDFADWADGPEIKALDFETFRRVAKERDAMRAAIERTVRHADRWGQDPDPTTRQHGLDVQRLLSYPDFGGQQAMSVIERSTEDAPPIVRDVGGTAMRLWLSGAGATDVLRVAGMQRATEQLQGAVDTLDAIARVLDRGVPDARKLATVTRLVHEARPATPGGQ